MDGAWIGNRQIRPWIAFARWKERDSINLPRPSLVDRGTLMSVASSPTPRERSEFKIVCNVCGSLSIKVADLVNAKGPTPVECARCGAVRGTLAGLRGLAISSGDVFQFESSENCK
jgi:hypothetical protein